MIVSVRSLWFVFLLCVSFFEGYCDHRELHVLTHSCPTRRSSDLPDWPLNTEVIADALRDVITDQCGARHWTAVDDLLARAAPRLAGGPRHDLLNGADALAGTIDCVAAMDATVLPIQGPPGTGKTYVTARAILSLVRKGYRVGVSSNSHEAIRDRKSTRL